MSTMTLSDGTTLHYETHDTHSQGPWLVLLNGMTQSTQHWGSQARALREHFRVLLYDARGQGGSDLPDAPPTLAQHAADLAELFDHLGIERAHLAGFSHGARVALGFANDFPERLDRLVLCSATARPTALAETIVRAWHQVLVTGGLEAMAWASLPTILGDDFLASHQTFLDNVIKASVQRNSQEGVRLLLEGLMAFPPVADLAGNLNVETLVISADQDLLVSTEGAKALADLLGGTHIVVERCGHTVPIERPDAFRDALLEFLN
ncbi:alpha/beta fold hydrolase [Lujinxingia vulgaris]|uniref:Alpha/beta fold hydrolase n=2 Tax=Lujinxingia vulgaris TaxID=2600176 RepID=A0A5C6XAU0_9DELT|nr:alpha/beta fold hydrolase [Lujinxingia vulgaris]